jgi:hypothetical protein
MGMKLQYPHTNPCPSPSPAEVQKYLMDKLSAAEKHNTQQQQLITRVCIAMMTDDERNAMEYHTMADLGVIVAKHAEKMKEQNNVLREAAELIPELIEFNDRLIAENAYLRQQLEKK